MPEPDQDIMRIEIRLFPKLPFTDLLTLKNPFAPLTVSSHPLQKDDDPMWKLFLALARFEGAQATLGRLTKHKKKEYVQRLKAGQGGWWKPEQIWGQFPAVLKAIKEA